MGFDCIQRVCSGLQAPQQGRLLNICCERLLPGLESEAAVFWFVQKLSHKGSVSGLSKPFVCSIKLI